MVLFKRRKLDYLPHPPQLTFQPNAEVWEIVQTGEVFMTYDAYLERRDFYHTKNFSCEVTGTRDMTFFEAFDSEIEHSREIESAFPEPLRGPVLRKVQFSILGRLEQLVTWVYDEFKSDFWPREHVIATLDDSDEKVDATIREKISFPERRRTDGSIEASAMSKYMVALDVDPSSHRDTDALVGSEALYRDRKLFSKTLLRSFLKNSIQKEPWHGAPWTVKPKLAQEFAIPTEIPAHLQHSARMAEKKAAAAQKKANEAENLTFFGYLGQKQQQQRPLEVRPPPKGGQKHRFIQTDISRFVQHGPPGQYPQLQLEPGQQLHPNMHHLQYGPQGQYQLIPQQQFPHQNRAVPAHNFHSNQFQPISNLQYAGPGMVLIPSQAAPPPPMKFPTEDLDVPPRKDAARRPSLKFFTEETPTGELQEDSVNKGIKMSSMGPLLETWNTLNVLAEVFILDSFTLDDFAEAMRFNSQELECELLAEVHCAVLKQIVDTKGSVQPHMTEFDSSDDDESDSQEEEDSEDPPTPEPAEPRRTTRSSLAKAEAKAIQERSPTPEQQQIHRAAEMLADRSWIVRLRDRAFRDGGWQTILVGLLYQLSLDEKKKEKCDKILSVLAPMDQEATDEVARFQYNALEPNLRIQALEMIVLLAIDTQAVRGHLEKMSASMTDLRKDKIQQQRHRKELIEELRLLDDQRKTIKQEMNAALPQPQTNGTTPAADIEIPDVSDVKAESSENSEDEPPRALRRGNDRKRKREEAAAKKEKAKKEKAAQPRKTKLEIRQEKNADDIEAKRSEILECEAVIDDITNDLRETDCQRTRCLGRDRFCNRYTWFERNGMPFGGVPDTSTAHYGYANGRIWVQGPDANMDVATLIARDQDEQARYEAEFGLTVPERKEVEEGDTHLTDATQWGYIDDPVAVDQLMGWLDERGYREKALRKELGLWRDMIVECMKKMRSHLDETEARKAADEEEKSAMRVSTRTKTYTDPDMAKWQCLNWHNSIALQRPPQGIGRLHSEGAEEEPAKKKSKKAAAAAAATAAPVEMKGTAIVKGKSAKSQPRQTRNK